MGITSAAWKSLSLSSWLRARRRRPAVSTVRSTTLRPISWAPLRTMASNTGCTSPGDAAITLRSERLFRAANAPTKQNTTTKAETIASGASSTLHSGRMAK